MCDEDNGPWLMIIDNADDEGLFFPKPGSQQAEGDRPLASFLPKTGRGSIIITSRRLEAIEKLVVDTDNVWNLSVMLESEAEQLLRKRLGEKYTKDHETTTGLIKALGYLPLALTQAAADIKKQRPPISLSSYLDELQGNDGKKAGLLGRDTGDLRRDESATNSVLRTWQITFEQVLRDRPSAAHLLSFMSFFSPQDIPKPILQAYVDNQKDTKGDSIDVLAEDLETLLGYSLVDVMADGDSFEMHALVQFCSRIWLQSFGTFESWKRTFLRIMSNEYPTWSYDTWEMCRRLEPHIRELVDDVPADGPDRLRLAKLLHNVGVYCLHSGMYNESGAVIRRALEAREERLGLDHPHTLKSLSLLASLLHHQGRYGEAEVIHCQVLKERERMFGPDHPDTLSCLRSIAVSQYRQGKEEAETTCQWAVERMVKVLGPGHISTAAAFSTLAAGFHAQGKYAEAEELHRRVLLVREGTLGEEHDDTIEAMGNLAAALRHQGKYEQAEALNRRGLLASERRLGPEHPRTLLMLSNIASGLRHAKKYEEAEAMTRRVLEARQKVLGEEHPYTLTSVGNLAAVLEDQEKYDEAEAMGRRALEGRQRVLGQGHRHTLAAIRRLISVLQRQGKHSEAEAVGRQAQMQEKNP